MWRWAIAIAFVLVAQVHIASANVRCITALGVIAQVNSPVACSVLSGSCTTFERNVTGYVEPSIVAASRGSFYTLDSGAALGVQCADSGTTHVIVTKSEYQLLIDSADAVTQLVAVNTKLNTQIARLDTIDGMLTTSYVADQSYAQWQVVLVLGVALLVGFMFGWKIIQRGSSQ